MHRTSLSAVVLTLLAGAALPAQRLLPGPERNWRANPPNGLGTKKVAVIQFNYADDPRMPTTAAQVRRRLCTDSDSVRAFSRDISFNAMSIGGHLNADGDVFGWFTLSANNKDLPSRVGELQQRAAGQGFVLANYDVVLYHNGSNQGRSGNAFGGKNAVIGTLDPDVVAHEVLHVLGLDHANGLRCTDRNGVPVAVADDFTQADYGDPFDSQGSGLFRHPSAYFKARMGWFFVDNVVTVPVTSTQTSTHTLRPIERMASGQTMCVRVPVPAGRIPMFFYWTNQVTEVPLFYYLEFRRPLGFDNVLPPAAEVCNGVSIRLGTDIDVNHLTMLVDSDPQTATFDDAPFTAGEVLDDTVSGVRIRVLSTSAIEARVEVSVRANATYSTGAHVLWSQPTSGEVALWSTDSLGNAFAARGFGPYPGMRATHYQRSGFPNAKLLWTRPDGLVKLWNLDAFDNLKSVKTIGPFPRWQGRAYTKLPDGTARLLWSRDDGLASIWRLDGNDDFTGVVQHGPFVAWTARGYQKLLDGTGKLLWSRTDGTCSIWDLDGNDNYVRHRYYGPYVDWTATDYCKLPDGTARLTWTRTDGTGSIWRLDANDNFVSVVQHGPFANWALEGFWYK